MASRITQSLTFHQSPGSFIFDRSQWPDSDDTTRAERIPPVVTAEILNRNVHIVSSYRLCKAILTCNETSGAREAEPSSGDARLDGQKLPPDTFTAGPAYEQLMAAFFPPPDILLQDGKSHHESKNKWKTSFAGLIENCIPHVEILTRQALNLQIGPFPRDRPFDLYEALKDFAWDLLLGVFLGLRRDTNKKNFGEIVSRQEDLLRGQFSLFPVALSVPFWSSARSRGLKAVRNLGPAMRKHLNHQWERSQQPSESGQSCPFAHGIKAGSSGLSEEEIVSHTRLFTSSIANKALASLLTAYFMNMFLWRDSEHQHDEGSLASLVASQADPDTRHSMLSSILLETARLSPPVVGVMRRSMETVKLEQDMAPDESSSHTIPAGHDAWLYFVAANRDPSVFKDPGEFRWDRFMSGETSQDLGLAFGAGCKTCLGADLTHQICITVMHTLLDCGLKIEGRVEEAGVKQWLGWDRSPSPEAMARDLKQLPCQKPRRPVMVTLCRNSME
ncbi:uncharacterized protein LTR77_007011 [Saxophila tyrrhenica]|uniref:Cytochrome P450 n=1 Tax=Saxophila tyrrhenica TaxID=1690608 RepID=A0AAV9P736_9PEZI|nr:hypothetical protein LTR77_007011 [Saxophila tyrrhenica]